MKTKSEMLSVAEALARVTGGFELIASEHISLPEALGRVLAEDVEARLTQPPMAVSSMDGYAVRSVDVQTVPKILTQVGHGRVSTLVALTAEVRLTRAAAWADQTDPNMQKLTYLYLQYYSKIEW